MGRAQPVHPPFPRGPAVLLIGPADQAEPLVQRGIRSHRRVHGGGRVGRGARVQCNSRTASGAWSLTSAQLGCNGVIVACPVACLIAARKALNVVFGIQPPALRPQPPPPATAASAPTNCRPARGGHESFRDRHRLDHHLHDVTATQLMVDGFASDLRRAAPACRS